MIKKICIILISIVAIIYIIKINNYEFHHHVNRINHKKINQFYDKYNILKTKSYKPQYKNIILLVIDGALKEYLYEENLSKNLAKRWGKKGLRFNNARCMLPSVSAPNYMSILSGAPVFIHGVINNYSRHKKYQKARIIFPYLKKKNISSAVIGFNWYRDILAKRTLYIPGECCEKDDTEEITNSIITMIDNGTLPDFTMAHYLAPDNAAHKTGSTLSLKYVNSFKEFDFHIGRLFDKLDNKYPGSMVLIISDHGMNIDGNHGGSDMNTIQVPFYIFADNIKGGSEIGRKIYNLSIVPTLSALFGTSIPGLSSGSLIHEIIDRNRLNSYFFESILKKKNLIESFDEKNIIDISLDSKDYNELNRIDMKLTEDIIKYPEISREKLLFKQRIAASVLLILLILFTKLKTGSRVQLIVFVNGGIITAMGLIMPLVNNANRYHISISLYIIILILFCFVNSYFSISKNETDNFINEGSVNNFFALMLPMTVILSAFFVPFKTYMPDEDIFAFRFFQVSFFNPFMYIGLVYFFNKIKLVAQKSI